jgi:abequosyltransferase
MKKPLLSICIATYNRANYIGETLKSILPQLTEDVELLIVDGASTDNTEHVINGYTENKSNVRYVRLSVKGGVDQDYDKSIELAQGEFCWLFTDDDLLKPGAVFMVLENIKKGFGLIIVNAEVRNTDLSEVVQIQRVVLKNNRIYSPSEMEDLFVDTVNYLSYIGAIVLRRNIWLNRDRLSYFGTEFIHIGVIFQKPLIESTLFVTTPYITIRHGVGQWEPRRFEVWIIKWPTLLWSFKTISAESIRNVTPKDPWRKFRTLMIQRSSGNYSVRIYKQHLSTKEANMLWKYCAIMIGLLPQNIFVALRYFYRLRKHFTTSIHSIF